MICTMTVSRNATNDFRTERSYRSWPYMQFPVFGGAQNFKPHISETAKDSPSILYSKSTQSTAESNRSGLEALRGRITKLAIYGKN